MMRRILSIGLFVVLVLALIAWVFFSPNKVLENYHIRSHLKQVETGQIDQVVKPYLGQSFWRLDLERLHAQIVRLDWVYKASVTRRWPNEIDITIEEQQPVVRWGKDALLNKNGDIFYPQNIKPFKDFVVLEGEDLQAKKLLSDLVFFQKKFHPMGWTIDRLSSQPDGGWLIHFWKHATVELDTHDWRHKLDRFLRAYPKIKSSLRNDALLYDLRYSNGFVVKQKTDSEHKDGTSS